MNKILIFFAFSFINTVLVAQLTIKVKVESVAVQNPLDCDGLTEGNSDFLLEFKATDNSAAVLTNNTPTVGSIGNCNFVSITENNGSYSLTPSASGSAIFSPSNGVFFNHSYNCHQNIPTALTLVWRGYENDDSNTPSTLPTASGITSINTSTITLPSNVTNTVMVFQYISTSPDLSCDQTYILNISVTISTGTFYPLFNEHTHENVICPGGTNGQIEGHYAGGVAPILIDWSNDGLGDYNDPLTITGLSVGNYTLVVKDALNCTDTITASITSIPAPVAISNFIQSAPSVCSGTTGIIYQVPTQTNAYDFVWQYSGAGALFSSTTESLVTVAFTGTATSGILSVFAINSCSTSPTLTMNVSINNVPNLAIAGNKMVCDNDNSTTLTATGALSYTWSTGATTSSVIIAPTTVTIYSVLASNNGCDATANYTVSVISSPTVSVAASSLSICPNECTTLTATGNGNLYLWSDGFLGITHSVTATSTTIYTVTTTYTNSCYAQSALVITVKAVPNLTITGNTMACATNTISLVASGADNYSWNTGQNTASITYTPFAFETLTLTGISNLTNCIATKTINIGNYPAGTVTITGNSNLCSNVPTTYTASGSDFYLWNNGATAATNTVLATSGTTTLQVVSTTSNGCKDSTSMVLFATQSPTVNLSAIDSICLGQSITLTASIAGASTFSWNTGATTASINVMPSTHTIYSITATNGGCTVIKTHSLGVKQLPVINFVLTPSIICSTASTITLGASPSGGNFSGVNVTGNIFDPNITNGVYEITYIVIGKNDCLSSATQSINVVFCVGVEENNGTQNGVEMYPNPVENELIIKTEKLMLLVDIFDFTGKLVGTDKLSSIENKINVSHLGTGLYNCRVHFENGKYSVLKFVKK